MLAARSLGLESGWIDLAMPLGDHRKILTEFSVPASITSWHH